MSYSLQPIDWSLPGSSVHGILQARILKQVAITSSRGSSWLRDQACISYVSSLGRQVSSATWEAPGLWWALSQKMNKNESVVSRIVTDSIVTNDKIQTFKLKPEFWGKTCQLGDFLLWAEQLPNTARLFWWAWWYLLYYIMKYVKIWKVCLSQQASSFLHGQAQCYKIMSGWKFHSKCKIDQWISRKQNTKFHWYGSRLHSKTNL